MDSAEPAFRLLTTEDADEARGLAILLDNANSLRKATEQELREERASVEDLLK